MPFGIPTEVILLAVLGGVLTLLGYLAKKFGTIIGRALWKALVDAITAGVSDALNLFEGRINERMDVQDENIRDIKADVNHIKKGMAQSRDDIRIERERINELFRTKV